MSKALLDEGHEVLIVEKEASICDAITDELGSVCLRGDGCEAAILAEAGTDRADILIAVTGDDEDNLVACQVAKHKFKVLRTIARIGNPNNEVLFKKLGIDVTVSSTNVILENIAAEVPTHPLTHLLAIRDRGLEIVEVRIPPLSPTIGKTVKQLSLPPESILCLIVRKKAPLIKPTDGTTIEEGDQVIAVTTTQLVESLRATLRGI